MRTAIRAMPPGGVLSALIALWVLAVALGQGIEQGAIDLTGLGYPRSEIARYVRGFAARCTVAALVTLAVLRARRLPRSTEHFYQRFVGEVDPRAVGFLRIATAGVAFLFVLVEDVADTASLPRELTHAHGVFALVHALPGVASAVASPAALGVFEALTLGVLGAAMLGVRARLTLPLGAFFYFVCLSLLRQPTWAYHTGLIPFYLLVVLSFAPWIGVDPGATLTLRPRPARLSREAAGWVRFTWVAVLFLPYVEAGLSKLCNAGPLWVGATNMRAILFMDSLDPMHFDFDGGLLLRGAPDFVFTALGVAGMVGEIAMVLALVSRSGKRFVPLAMLFMHVGIVLLQNILFPDLILLLVAFYAMVLLFDRRTGSPFDVFHTAAQASVRDAPGPRRRATRFLAVTLVVMGAFWTLALEFFPFTAMQMYARVRGPEVEYTRLYERTASGWSEARPEEVFPSLMDSRYRLALRRCVGENEDPRCDLFLTTFLEARGDEVDALRVEKRRWNFRDAPDDPDFGNVVALHRFPR